MSAVTLPELTWKETPAHSSRNGRKVRLVVIHTWGVGRWPTEKIGGVVNYFMNPANQVSSHFVYGGETGKPSPKGQCYQMVSLADKAWTQAAFNSESVSIECTDYIWQGKDMAGLNRVARMTGWLLKEFDLPDHYVGTQASHLSGFCRHGDLGVSGGGHPFCPTTNMALWNLFVARVKYEYDRDHYRDKWAR